MILITAHSFGLGPAGLAFELAKKLSKSFSVMLILAKECASIIEPDLELKYAILPDLSLDQLEKSTEEFNFKFSISVLCKGGVDLAKKLQIPSILIDPIAWFWKNIPEAYLAADFYLALKHPGVEKIFKAHQKAHVISQIIPEVTRDLSLQNIHTVHLGGVQNPFENTLPKSYLKFIYELVKKCSELTSDKMVIISGLSVANYLKTLNTSDQIQVLSLNSMESAKYLSSSKRVTSLPGLTGPLISFNAAVPVGFIAPINLSQYWHLKSYRENGAATQSIDWPEIFEMQVNFEDMEERDSFYLFHKFGDDLLKLSNIETIKEKVCDIMLSEINVSAQLEFAKSLGSTGADDVASFIRQLL